MYYVIAILLVLLTPLTGRPQSTPPLDKMPPDLETELALSSLPPHLRPNATVYLLDPAKGYYVSKKGSSGFICLVGRTDWEWADFRKDIYTPIAYNADGAKTMGIIYLDVAAMRATGKFTARQVRDSVIARFKTHRYSAPAHEGISFMLAPIMRIYTGDPGDNTVKTMSMPHYMFFAPYVDAADIGVVNGSPGGPWLTNPGNTVMGAGKGPHGFIVMPANEEQATKIRNDNKTLLQRLAAYNPLLKADAMPMHH
jgi:hypothetical protein